uniref:FMN hydroxy acid dehydrogenase domain-containing protein n=1 Tax=Caenorhabditis japonica TaxID=281687 RepID=A0A8R1E0W9_CAEJA
MKSSNTAALLTLDDYRKYSERNLTKLARDYYESGAEEEKTLRRNQQAFDRLLIRPHCLRSVESIDTSIEWLNGRKLEFPIGIAPTAFQKMATTDGELSTVRGAAASKSIMICSSWGTTSIVDIGKEAKIVGATIWFQLYVYKDRAVTEALIHRAESAGVEALVLTVDTPVLGRRLKDTYNKFSLPKHLKFANFESESQAEMPKGAAGESGFMQYVSSQIDPSLDWSTLQWIRSKTNLPVIVKGVMRGDDALLALEAGVDGIIVSNHGGRQLDSCIATIEALPDVVRAVDGQIPVFLDGGVRNGRDILKAVAIGARGVFVGRPVLWGLATAGSTGVSAVVGILQSEFRHAMQLSGFRSIKELQRDEHTIVYESKL